MVLVENAETLNAAEPEIEIHLQRLKHQVIDAVQHDFQLVLGRIVSNPDYRQPMRSNQNPVERGNDLDLGTLTQQPDRDDGAHIDPFRLVDFFNSHGRTLNIIWRSDR